MSFALHPALAKDCVEIGELPLCRVLLMQESRFPWCVLVPQVEDACELFDLSPALAADAMREAAEWGAWMKRTLHAHKINIALLGNQVSQLHIHIIARFANDCAWPQPVWCAPLPRIPYTPEDVARIASLLQRGHAELRINSPHETAPGTVTDL